MKPLLLLLLCGAVLGCRRKKAEVPPPVPVEAAQPAATPEAATRAVPATPPPRAPGTPAAPAVPPNAVAQDPVAVRRAVEAYFNARGGTPKSWQEVIAAGYLKTVPLAKNGQPLDMQGFFLYHP